jgi:SSS family solute:Na+ symporter
MSEASGWLAPTLILGYLALALIVGIRAGRGGGGGVTDFVAGDRAFGPVVMYFVMGATIFSAFALLGTPQRVVTKGSDTFYILAYGAVGLVPLFFFGGKVRTLGARLGYVTHGELVGGRFNSRAITGVMGVATLMAFLPYIVIQLKGAALVMEAVFGWSPLVGAAVVYTVVVTYVAIGGVRGVGWTNVMQGIGMLVVVWGLGLWVTHAQYGGVGPMFERVMQQSPQHLTLPGPGLTSSWTYTSEVLVSILGFTMWPQVFMKCFTARSGRLVQLSTVLYPSFLFFILPLIWLGYVAVLEGGPQDDTVLFWVAQLPVLGDSGIAFALVAFAVLAASMSTGDALLHAGGSILVRDVAVGALGWKLTDRQQTRMMRGTVVGLGVAGLGVFEALGGLSVVELLFLGYAVIIQFLPATMLGLYWRRAHRDGAWIGLLAGLTTVLALFALGRVAPDAYAAINPLNLQIGVLGLAVNGVLLVVLSLLRPSMDRRHLEQFGL